MSLAVNWVRQAFPELTDVAELGGGGQKLVFSAIHPSDGDVVLKLLRPTHQPADVQREMLAVVQIKSPRVPLILEHGQIATPLGPCYWLREQRVSGVTLRRRLLDGPLPWAELLRLAYHVLQALAKAEDERIVHRDVKPENIMRASDGAYWLLDFGLARHLDLPSLTATAAPFGKFTPGYAPPEQFRNLKRTIDARSDLFGLGVTLHECATGSNPFLEGSRDLLEVLRRTEWHPLPALVLSSPDGGKFSDLVAAMTQKRRDQRIGTVREALEWLLEFYEDGSADERPEA